MKKILFWTLFTILSCLLVGCLYNYSTPVPPEPYVVVITVVVTATPGESDAPVIIATTPRTTPSQAPSPVPTQAPSATPTPEPSHMHTRAPSATPTPKPSHTPMNAPSNTPLPQGNRRATPVPDYKPGGGMAVLEGESPYELTILPGGWQAYKIGPSANEWGYLVDVNPLGAAPKGAYVESKILPEYFAGQWVDVLWLHAPGIQNSLPVSLDLIPTQGWNVTYENYTKLTPSEWTGWGMFDNAEGCGGVLDISPDNIDQSGHSAYVQNFRVQPEFPGNWVQVIRVQLSSQAVSQNAWLRYYAPGPLGVEKLRKKATLSPGNWNGFVVAQSSFRQGYVVEVIPQRKADNEVAFAVVRPESNGDWWDDVLRVYVPEGRPPLEALLRVLAVKVATI
jgi:hypothetical protein